MNLLRKKFTLPSSWVLLLGNGFSTLLNFLFVSILSHHLFPKIYGEYREVFLYANLLVTIGVAGFSQTIYYFLNHEIVIKEKLRTIGQTRILLIIFQIILLFSITILWYFKLLVLPIHDFYDIVFFGVYCFFTTITLIDINISIVFQKNVLIITSNLFLLCVKIIALLYIKQIGIGLSNVIFLSAIIQILIFIINQIILKDTYWGNISLSHFVDSDKMKAILKYNIPLAISVLIGFLTSNTDRFLLSLIHYDAERFAILSNVAFEVPFIGNIYTSFFTIALPIMINCFKNKDIDGFFAARRDYTKQVAILVFPIVISFIIWHREFIQLAFGEHYISDSYLFAIYALISLMRVCSHIDVLLATNNTRYIFYIQLVEFIVRLILSYFLYNTLGLKGFIYAAVITNIMYVIYVNFLSAKLLAVNMNKIFPYFFLFKNLIVIISLALLSKYFMTFFTQNWLLQILLYCILVSTYILINYKSYIVKKLLTSN